MQTNELRDIIALDKYGKIYSALPDDGPEKDYVAGEAERRGKNSNQTSPPKLEFDINDTRTTVRFYAPTKAIAEAMRDRASLCIAAFEGVPSDKISPKLTASAPELLAALEDLIFATAKADGLIAKARKVIARAKGETL